MTDWEKKAEEEWKVKQQEYWDRDSKAGCGLACDPIDRMSAEHLRPVLKRTAIRLGKVIAICESVSRMRGTEAEKLMMDPDTLLLIARNLIGGGNPEPQ